MPAEILSELFSTSPKLSEFNICEEDDDDD